jgi:hypothetical protein
MTHLFAIVLILIIVGVVLWLVNTYVPMDVKIKTILNVFVVIVVIVWLLYLISGYLSLR